MANFFLDNEDIQFLFDHIDMKGLAEIQELETPNGDNAEYLPLDAEDMVDNYRRILEVVGEISGDTIAPSAEQVDAEGNTLNDDGTVTLHPLVQRNLDRMTQADLMGATLPRKYGGLNCPNTLYTMAVDMVSRADASFMNMFGLQGIAETIYAFANDEIKNDILPRFAEGEVTGAMVLTEPDAGSDLQAVRLRAYQDDEGEWRLNGVKRFITNGCGEILLVLARTEPDVDDGRGLSLLVCERDPTVRVRHLEDKLGIHGSPTCELVFNDTKAKLIGERQRGLIKYVIALMNGARIGIAGQSLGIGEAAYRLARSYANSREQFGLPIERIPAVAQLVTEMKVEVEAARALTYMTAGYCDQENNNTRILEWVEISPEEKKVRHKRARELKRLNAMLTPMSKMVGSEMCIDVANKGVQVLGGSGFIKDYPAERYLRDSRITSIYEGTTQLQVVAAIKGVTSGVFKTFVEKYEATTFDDPALEALKAELIVAKDAMAEAVVFAKTKGGSFMDLSARRLVESAVYVLTGHLFLKQATECDRKKSVAKFYIEHKLPELRKNLDMIHGGNDQPFSEYALIAGPVPVLD
jgi:3-(methylthio)propanoyl-CoA dehydrogenase